MSDKEKEVYNQRHEEVGTHTLESATTDQEV